MSKRMLMIERCGDCPYFGHIGGLDYCWKEARHTIDKSESLFMRQELRKEIPDWCPLPAMPKRMETQGCAAPDTYFRKAMGWNACLDEIEGGNENEKTNSSD